MILFNSEKLADAINDKDHKHYDAAKMHDETIRFLRKKYKGHMRFIRPGYPRKTKGADSRGFEIPSMAKPTEPLSIKLEANVFIDGIKGGKNHWACCLDTPKLLPGNLWGLGNKRRIHIYDDFLVNLDKDPDLGFFLYKISPFVKKGFIRLQDPEGDDAELGKAEYLRAQRKMAVWTMLEDEKKLRTMARGYGIAGTDKKQPNAIRKELEALLEKNDKLQEANAAVKGTKDFMDEMHITDSLILRSFVQKCIDAKKLTYHVDGRWKVGEKIVVQVPASDLERKMEYLCSYLQAGNNREKLQEFLKDLINKEYLDSVALEKEWTWLFKVATDESPAFKKKDEIKTRVTEFFCPVG